MGIPQVSLVCNLEAARCTIERGHVFPSIGVSIDPERTRPLGSVAWSILAEDDQTMRDHRHRQLVIHHPLPTTAVPDAQTRALERRLWLDEQQRAFQGHHHQPDQIRRRPPA